MEASPESARMRAYLQRVATGPELSRDLDADEARDAMTLILRRQVHDVQAGVFLIALRMKRETAAENRGVLEAVLAHRRTAVVAVDDLLVIGDPFDGFERGLPVSPALPAVLAALGQPTVSHGLWSVGPKHGVTHARVLAEAGLAVDLEPAEAARRIADADIGWAYLDQSRYCPPLHALVPLRELIVKRPCLTTIESVVPPLDCVGRMHLLTGYVHKAYPAIYGDLARCAGYHGALVVRGVEGGVIASLAQPARARQFRGGGAEEDLRLDPADAGIRATERAVPWPAGTMEAGARAAAARAAIESALAGEPGPAREALVHGASVVLVHLGCAAGPAEAAERVREILDNGSARARFERAKL